MGGPTGRRRRRAAIMSGMPEHGAPGTTIRCEHVVELVTDYLEGTLDPATVTEFEAHLALCPGCAEYLDQIRDTVRRLGRVSLEELPDTARTRLLAAFEAMSVEHRPSMGRLPDPGSDAEPVT
jgi:anti-sigma factor RsiW